jgi:hypothetical protein
MTMNEGKKLNGNYVEGTEENYEISQPA